MVAELFEKTTLKSYFLSIFMFFLIVFIHYSKNNGVLRIEFLPNIIIFWLLFSGIIFLIRFFRKQKFY